MTETRIPAEIEVVELTQPLRADEVTEPAQCDLYQQNASAVEAGLYLVPKVIE